MSVIVAGECHGIIDISGTPLRLVNSFISSVSICDSTSEVGSTTYTGTELYLSARSDNRNYEPMFDTISFKSSDSGSSKANDDNIIIKGLIVLYSNVNCVATKTNKIKLVMSKRHEVSVFAFTEMKPKHTLFAVTDIQNQVPGFELLTNVTKPNGRGITVFVRSLLQATALTVNSDILMSLGLSKNG